MRTWGKRDKKCTGNDKNSDRKWDSQSGGKWEKQDTIIATLILYYIIYNIEGKITEC